MECLAGVEQEEHTHSNSPICIEVNAFILKMPFILSVSGKNS